MSIQTQCARRCGASASAGPWCSGTCTPRREFAHRPLRTQGSLAPRAPQLRERGCGWDSRSVGRGSSKVKAKGSLARSGQRVNSRGRWMDPGEQAPGVCDEEKGSSSEQKAGRKPASLRRTRWGRGLARKAGRGSQGEHSPDSTAEGKEQPPWSALGHAPAQAPKRLRG